MRAGGPSDEASRAAMAELCQVYWPPLYSFLRRRGHSREKAEDLTQDFFVRLLERRSIRAADPARGRFRSFLLTALRRYVINEHERATAAKRGGPQPPLALDFDDAERAYLLGIRSDDTPERAFDRQWATLLIDRALNALRGEYENSGRTQLANALLPYLTDLPPYAEVGGRLGMKEGAVRTALHRLRRRFHAILRRQVADTVRKPEDVNEEMRELIRIVGA